MTPKSWRKASLAAGQTRTRFGSVQRQLHFVKNVKQISRQNRLQKYVHLFLIRRRGHDRTRGSGYENGLPPKSNSGPAGWPAAGGRGKWLYIYIYISSCCGRGCGCGCCGCCCFGCCCGGGGDCVVFVALTRNRTKSSKCQ